MLVVLCSILVALGARSLIADICFLWRAIRDNNELVREVRSSSAAGFIMGGITGIAFAVLWGRL